MDASGAYTAGYTAGLKGVLFNNTHSSDSSVQTSYASGYNTGKALYTPAFTVGYKDAAKGLTVNTFYSANKAVQAAYNAGYYSLTQTNKIVISSALEWFVRVAVGSGVITSITFDSNNNIIIGGNYNTSATLHNKDGSIFKALPATTTNASFLAKYTSDGVGIWSITYDTAGNFDSNYKVVVDSNDNVYVAGAFHGTLAIKNADGTTYASITNIYVDALLIKYNSAGAVQWYVKSTSANQADANEVIFALDVDTNGNVYIGFYYNSSITFYNSNSTTAFTVASNASLDCLIAKFNSAGMYVWHSVLSSSGSDLLTHIKTDYKGNVYACGYYATTLTLKHAGGATYGSLGNSGSNDGFMIKYDTSGQIQWVARVGGAGDERCISIGIDSFNKPYVYGQHAGTTTFYNGSGTSYTSVTAVGADDNFIVKYNEEGAIQWINRIGGTGIEANETTILETWSRLAFDKFNNLYVANTFASGTLNMYSASNLSSAVSTLTNTASRNGYLVKYDSSGTFLYATKTGNSSTNSTYNTTLAIDSANQVYVGASNVGGTFLFFNSAQGQTANGPASNNLYLIKYNQRNSTAKTAYDVGYAAKIAGTAQNTSYSTIQDVQAAYNAGYENAASQSTEFYYMGFNDAFRNKILDPTVSANATLQTAYTAGFAAGQAAYKVAYGAGYTDATQGRTRNTSYSAADISSNEIAPKQGAYDMGYYAYQNAINFHALSFDWFTKTGNSTNTEGGRLVAIDTDSNIYHAGIYNTGSAPVVMHNGTVLTTITGAPADSAYIIKQTPAGALLQALRLQAPAAMNIFAINVDSQRFIYVVGSISANIEIYNNVTGDYLGTIPFLGIGGTFVAKLTPQGVLVWSTRITAGSAVQNISFSSDNSIYVGFSYGGTVNVYDKTYSSIVKSLASIGGSSDWGLVKFTGDGTFTWGVRIGGGANYEYLYATSVDPEGNIYIAGDCGPNNPAYFYDNNNNSTSMAISGSFEDGVLVKVSKDGQYIWHTIWNSGPQDYFYNVVADNSGNVIVSGSSQGGAYITAKYSSTGTSLWAKGGVGNYFEFPEVDRENNIYAYVGTSLIKYDPSGNALASFTHGLTAKSAILIDNNNNVYMMGSITTATTVTGLDSSGNTAYSASSGSASTSDSILVKYIQKNNAISPAYLAGYQAYEAGANQNTSYSAILETQAAYDAGYTASSASHYNAGYSDGVKGYGQATTYSTSEAKQARYNAGYSAGSALFSAAFSQGYKDGSRTRGKRTYSTNQYVQSAYEQGCEWYVSAAQTTTVKSNWFTRTAGTGTDSADAIAKDSLNNIYYGGHVGNANATVFSKFGTGFSTLTSTTQSAFIVKQNEEGATLWATRFASTTSTCRIVGITCDKDDNVYSYGIFAGTLTAFRNGSTAYPRTISSVTQTSAGFIVKQSPDGSIVWLTAIAPTTSVGTVIPAAIAYDNQTHSIYVNGSYLMDSVAVYNANGTIGASLPVSLGTFAPTSIANCVAWFDAADFGGLASGATVDRWLDKSGLNNHANRAGTVTVAASRLNGHTGLSINRGFSLTTPAVFPTGSTGQTLFIVVNTAPSTNSDTPFGFGDEVFGFQGDGTFYCNFGYSSRLQTGVAYTGQLIHTAVANRSNATVLFKNGTQVYTNTYSTRNVNTGFNIGNNQYGYLGTIYEIIAFNRTLTVSEQQQVEGYLAYKWGQRGLLAAGHPYKSAYPGTSGVNTNDTFLAKYNVEGTEEWVTRIAGTSVDNARTIATDGAGSVYQIADTSGVAVIYDISNNNAGSVTSAGSSDVIISKYTAAGTASLFGRISSTGTDIAYSATVDTSNNLCIVGRYGGLLTFYNASGSAYGTQLSTIGGAADGFMVKYNAAGAVQLVSRLGGSGTDFGVSIATDKENNQYLLATAGTNVGLYNSNLALSIPSPVDSLSTSAVQDGLKAFYATRKVRSAYTGPLFKVRRGSDNVELDFYSDMFGVYTENADGTGQTLTAWLNGATAFIRTWYDQSKYGNHATQTTAASQPIFDLTNKYMDFKTNRFMALPDGAVPGNNSKYTITYKHNTIPVQSGFSPILYSGNFTSNQAILITLVNTAGGGVLYYRDDWRANSTEFIGYAPGNTFTATYDQANARSYLNGSLAQTVAKSGQSNPSTNNYIGYVPASNFPYMNGEIYYLSIFENVLSDTDRLIVENNTTATINSPAATLANANSYSILAKYNAAGGLLWSNIVSTNFSTQGSKYLTIDDNYNIYVAGSATGTAIIDSAGATSYTLTNAGSTDAVLIQYRQRNDTLAAYTAGTAAYAAGSQLNTSYSADTRTQAAYAAGFAYNYEYFYYAGYNTAFKNMVANTTFSSNATYQASYNAGHAAGVTAYKAAYTAGYKDAQLNLVRKTAYGAGSNVYEAGPKQAGYDDGYYTQKNGLLGPTLVYDWQSRIGNTTNSEAATSVAVDADNNIWSIGNYTGNAPVRDSLGNVIFTIPASATQGGYIIKQTPSGTVLKAYNLTTTAAIDMKYVGITSDNKIYIVGIYQANLNLYDAITNTLIDTIQYTGGSGQDCFVSKLGQEGAVEWTCRVKNLDNHIVRAACIDREDNIIFSFVYGAYGAQIFNKNDVAAFSFGSNNTNGDAGFVKISADGIPLWGGYCAAIGGDNLYSIAAGFDGSVYVCGSNSGGTLQMVNTTPSQAAVQVAGGNDSFMFSVDKNGIFKWNKGAFNGGTIATDNSNNVIVRTGSSLVKYNAAGATQWSLGSSIDPHTVDKDNNIYGFSGSTVIKVSAAGASLYSATHGFSAANRLFLDNTNSIYLVGSATAAAQIAGFDSYGNIRYTTSSSSASTSDAFLIKYKQKTSAAYPTYYTAGFTSYSAATYTTAYSADAETQATYDAGYQVAADSFVVYYVAGISDAAAGTSINNAYSADTAIQTAYSNGYTAYTTSYNAGFTAGSSGSPSNNTYTSNATLSARYISGYTAGVESVAVIVVTDAKRSVATLQINRTATLESSVVSIANITGLDASGNFQASSAPYISSATSAKGFTTALADKLVLIETTYTPRTYVDQRISTIVNAAPAALNTLKEIADSLANNPSFYSTVVTSTITEENRSVSSIVGLSTLNASRADIAATQQELIRTDISGEIERATQAETSLSTSITTQGNFRVAEISSISQTLQTQVNLATANDGLLSTLINAQTAQRQSDVASLNNSDLGPINSTITSINLKTDNKMSTSVSNLSTTSSILYSEIERATVSISTIEALATAQSSTSIGSDSTIRLSLDTNIADLSSNLIAEISRAMSTESGLSTSVGTKKVDGISTISSFTDTLLGQTTSATAIEHDISGILRSTLLAEESRATTVEQGLSTALGLQTASATTNEGAINTALTLQTATSIAAEQDISGAIRALLTTEVGRAGLAETGISTNLTTEISRATGAEGALTTSIVSESARAVASMSTISAAILSLITTEQVRASTIEAGISTNLSTEIGRATGAEATLSTSIVSESGRAVASMSTISSAVLSLITTEQGRASTIERAISTNMGSEKARSISTVIGHTSTLSAEQARAQAAEAALSSSLQVVSIDGERGRAIAAEADISANLATEVTRATSAEDTLSSTVGALDVILSTITTTLGPSSAFSGNYITGLSTIKSAIETLDSQLYSTTSTYASITYVDNRISTFINGASSILNTLVEIDTALNNDPAFASTLISTVGAETVRATDAETGISTNLATESSRASGVETSLTSTIAGETARSVGVIADISGSIYSAISTASGLAKEAESLISTTVATESSRAIGAESTITADLGAEISRASLAEQDISGALHALVSAEQSRATTAEQGLSTALASESSRAIGAESAVTSALGAEISRAGLAEQDISGALRTLVSAEQSRATTAEQGLSTAIKSEETRAITAEQSISTTIGDEISRSLTAIADISSALQTLITTETSRSQAQIASISTAITNETARADAAETTLTGSLNVEIARAQGAEQDISGALHLMVYNESVRATDVETDISGRLLDQTVQATTAEQATTSTIAGTYIVRADYGGQASINTVGTLGAGTWQASTIATTYGGTGVSSYSKGDIVLGSASGSLEKLSVGSTAYALKADGNSTAAWSVQDASSIVLTSAANFTGASNLQQALNFLYANTKIRKVIDHVLTNSANYSDPAIPNANFVLGKVHFINYDASSTIIYLPPVHQNVTYADGTVYRLVHNGEPETDGTLIIRYRSGTINGAGTTITGTTYTVLEMGPRDSICIIWDQDTTSYKYATGV
jgi:hypothetical protein